MKAFVLSLNEKQQHSISFSTFKLAACFINILWLTR